MYMTHDRKGADVVDHLRSMEPPPVSQALLLRSQVAAENLEFAGDGPGPARGQDDDEQDEDDEEEEEQQHQAEPLPADNNAQPAEPSAEHYGAMVEAEQKSLEATARDMQELEAGLLPVERYAMRVLESRMPLLDLEVRFRRFPPCPTHFGLGKVSSQVAAQAIAHHEIAQSGKAAVTLEEWELEELERLKAEAEAECEEEEIVEDWDRNLANAAYKQKVP